LVYLKQIPINVFGGTQVEHYCRRRAFLNCRVATQLRDMADVVQVNPKLFFDLMD
jgi:hypothetical protein